MAWLVINVYGHASAHEEAEVLDKTAN